MSERAGPVAGAPPRARPASSRASVLTLLALVGAGVVGAAVAGSPLSPVREWAVHVTAPSVAISLASPDDAPTTFAPGQPLSLPLVVRRAGEPPLGDDAVEWRATFVPDDGSSPAVLGGGSTSAPTGRSVPVPLSVVITADVPGHLLVALTAGASVDVRLSPSDGPAPPSPTRAPAPPPTAQVAPGG